MIYYYRNKEKRIKYIRKREKWILILKIVVVVVVGVVDEVGCLVLFYSVILLKLIVGINQFVTS